MSTYTLYVYDAGFPAGSDDNPAVSLDTRHGRFLEAVTTIGRPDVFVAPTRRRMWVAYAIGGTHIVIPGPFVLQPGESLTIEPDVLATVHRTTWRGRYWHL